MSTESDVTTHALRELCANMDCERDIGRVPSVADSHRYGVSAFGDLVNHVSTVVCPSCGWTLLRRHAVPFRVRVDA